MERKLLCPGEKLIIGHFQAFKAELFQICELIENMDATLCNVNADTGNEPSREILELSNELTMRIKLIDTPNIPNAMAIILSSCLEEVTEEKVNDLKILISMLKNTFERDFYILLKKYMENRNEAEIIYIEESRERVNYSISNCDFLLSNIVHYLEQPYIATKISQ